MNSYESIYKLFEQESIFQRYSLPDGLISAMKTIQRIQLPSICLSKQATELQKNMERYAILGKQLDGAISLLKTYESEIKFTQSQQYKQLMQSFHRLNENIQRWELCEQMQNIAEQWEPSDILVESIDLSMQKAAKFPLEAEQSHLASKKISEPLTKTYVKDHFFDIVNILITLLIFLYTHVQDQQSAEQMQEMIANQEIVISQNDKIIETQQTIIEQNKEEAALSQERNDLLETLIITLQAVNDETNIFGEQTDALVEQDNDLIQTLDSPSNDDTSDSKQQ